MRICTACHLYMAFSDLRNTPEFSKDFYGHLIPQIFILSFLVSFLFTQTGTTISGSCAIKQFLILLEKYLGIGISLLNI